jgi:Nup85 Nucleoporin
MNAINTMSRERERERKRERERERESCNIYIKFSNMSDLRQRLSSMRDNLDALRRRSLLDNNSVNLSDTFNNDTSSYHIASGLSFDLDTSTSSSSSSSEHAPIVVPVEGLGDRRGVHAALSWRGDEALAACWPPVRQNGEKNSGESNPRPAHHKSSSDDDSDTDGALFCTLEWSSGTSLAETRQLVGEAHGRFVAVQAHQSGRGEQLAKALLSASRHYRAMLYAHRVAIDDALRLGRDCEGTPIRSGGEIRQRYGVRRRVVCASAKLWHLCEILYLVPTSRTATQLVGWLQEHFTRAGDLDSIDALCDAAGEFAGRAEDSPDFWPLLARSLVAGRVDDARRLLAEHSSHRQRHYAERAAGRQSSSSLSSIAAAAAVDVLLAKMPAGGGGDWRQWRRDAASLRERADVGGSDDALDGALAIMCGDAGALRAACSSWPELLVGSLLYARAPQASLDGAELRVLAERCALALPSRSAIDRVLEAALTQGRNAFRALREADAALGDRWLAAHLTDLLFHAGHIERYQLDLGVDLREFYLLEYAGSLDSDAWRIAADYLRHCPTFGGARIERLLGAQPARTELDVVQLLRAMSALDVGAPARRQLMSATAARHAATGRNAAAVRWYLLAQHSARAASIANTVLDAYLAEPSAAALRALIEPIVLEPLDAAHLDQCRSVAFLFHLYRLEHARLLASRRQPRRIAELVVRLLASHTAPSRALLHVLHCAALPLLNTDNRPPLFDVEATHNLLQALQDSLLSAAHARTAFAIGTSSNAERHHFARPSEAQVQPLRIALATHLSHALLDSNSS